MKIKKKNDSEPNDLITCYSFPNKYKGNNNNNN